MVVDVCAGTPRVKDRDAGQFNRRRLAVGPLILGRLTVDQGVEISGRGVGQKRMLVGVGPNLLRRVARAASLLEHTDVARLPSAVVTVDVGQPGGSKRKPLSWRQRVDVLEVPDCGELNEGLAGLGRRDLLSGQLSGLATDWVGYSMEVLKQGQDVLKVLDRRGRTLVEHGDGMLLPGWQVLRPLLDFAEDSHLQLWPQFRVGPLFGR